MILTQIKALIARDAKSMEAYFEIVNKDDSAILKAVNEVETGKADFPLENP